MANQFHVTTAGLDLFYLKAVGDGIEVNFETRVIFRSGRQEESAGLPAGPHHEHFEQSAVIQRQRIGIQTTLQNAIDVDVISGNVNAIPIQAVR